MSGDFKATVSILSSGVHFEGVGHTKESALLDACPTFENFGHLEAAATVGNPMSRELWHKSPRVDWVRRK